MTLAPGEWRQLDDVLAGAGFAQGYARVSAVAGSGPWFAYAVFNDEGTNDGSFVPFEAGTADAGTRLVPAVVEAGPYSTEVVLANPAATARDVALTYVESLSPEKGSGGVLVERLGPGEQKVIPSFLEALRASGGVGPKGEASYSGALTARFLESGASAGGTPRRGPPPPPGAGTADTASSTEASGPPPGPRPRRSSSA